MEVYVDDMIVRAENDERHCKYLEDAFQSIRRHNIRLNPEKCSFGIEGGKFLGYMISARGIEANPDKCRAIIEMRSPTNVLEVQKLNGKLAALARFIPQSAGKSAPFFKCLKKSLAFNWTLECEQSFQDLKNLLSTPPVLTKPMPGVPLMLYLSITDTAVGSVLVQDKEGAQQIIYFYSYTLKGAEKRYQRIEKGVLAILMTTRKLRAYFQSFRVKVKTDLPLRQILQRPDMAGRTVGRSVESSEYGLEFEPRGPIKAQVLADFVTELTPAPAEHSPKMWTLFVDGSSNAKGSGAGLILLTPDEAEIEQCLKFEFKASNNQAEYEAMIAGLTMALDLGVTNLTVNSDSQLVVSQISGDYQAKDDTMAKYLARVQQLIERVGSVQINYVPREGNKRADELAKLATMKNPGCHKTAIHATLSQPTINMLQVNTIAHASSGWMSPITAILNASPEDYAKLSEAKKRDASHYVQIGEHLYRQGFTIPLLKCVTDEEAKDLMKEVHEGVCASHIGGVSLAAKVLRAGFYWSTMRKDCLDYVKRCDKCQRFSKHHKASPKELTSILTPDDPGLFVFFRVFYYFIFCIFTLSHIVFASFIMHFYSFCV